MLISFLLGFLSLSWEIKTLYIFIKVRKYDPALKWTHWILPIAAAGVGSVLDVPIRGVSWRNAGLNDQSQVCKSQTLELPLVFFVVP